MSVYGEKGGMYTVQFEPAQRNNLVMVNRIRGCVLNLKLMGFFVCC